MMQRKFMSLFFATVTLFGVFACSLSGVAQTPAADSAPDPASAASAATDPAPSARVESDTPEYARGMKAMDEGRWNDALKAFDQVAAAHNDRSEAALYWKAYSLEKLGRKDDAQATCEQLVAADPQSTWRPECMALRVEAGVHVQIDEAKMQADMAKAMTKMDVHLGDFQVRLDDMDIDLDELGDSGQPHDPNDDLKLMALSSLMRQEPEKALPILRDFIASKRPVEVRRRALFVLGESKAPGAQELLTEIATKNGDPVLQRAAVQTLATMRGKAAAPELVTIYKNSSDHGVKRAAVNGLFIAGDASGMVELARAEKDMEMKRDIVSQLALMHDPAATAYMEELLK